MYKNRPIKDIIKGVVLLFMNSLVATGLLFIHLDNFNEIFASPVFKEDLGFLELLTCVVALFVFIDLTRFFTFKND